MKKMYVLIAFMAAFVAEAWAGTGTSSDPYSVAEAILVGKDIPAGTHVVGYIVGGRYDDFDYNGNEYGISIADDVSETDVNNCFQVKLVSALRSQWHPKNDPTLIGKMVIVSGSGDGYGGYPAVENNVTINFYTPPVAGVPMVNATLEDLGVFVYYVGSGPGSVKEFKVYGAELEADLVITASANMEVSTAETSGFSSSVTLTPTDGAVAETPIYVCLKGELAEGTYADEKITLSSTNATDVQVLARGAVVPSSVTMPYSEDLEGEASIAERSFANYNVATDATFLWEEKTYSNNTYAQMASHGSTSASDEVWLITPGFQIGSEDVKVAFDVNVGFWKHEGLSVKVSTNYDQTKAGITSATWDDITSNFTIPQEPTSAYGTFAPAGEATLSGYSGMLYLAFVYTGSKDAGETTTYQIDNISVQSSSGTATSSVAADKLRLFPNPATVSIQVSSDADALVFFDLSGEQVLSVYDVKANEKIDISALDAGVYFVKIKRKERTDLIKMIKK